MVVCARGEEALKNAADGICNSLPRQARASRSSRPMSRPKPATSKVDRRRGREFGRIDVARQQRRHRARAPISKRPPMPSGRRRSIRRCFPAIRMSRLAVPHIRKQGGGAIVIVSSIFGRESGGRMTYNAVKAAEISLTKSLAQQLAKDQIRVVSVAPGSIAVRRRVVVEAPAGGSRGHREVHQAGAAVRTIRQARRSRRGDRVPRVAESELDQRNDRRCRRLPVADVLGRRLLEPNM